MGRTPLAVEHFSRVPGTGWGCGAASPGRGGGRCLPAPSSLRSEGSPADPPLTPAPGPLRCYMPPREKWICRPGGSWQPAGLAASSRTVCGVQTAPCLLPVWSLEGVQSPCSRLSLCCLSWGRLRRLGVNSPGGQLPPSRSRPRPSWSCTETRAHGRLPPARDGKPTPGLRRGQPRRVTTGQARLSSASF